MTTNEGTTALIAEAREHWVELNGLNSRAAEVLLQIADALEAATSEQGSAGDIRRAVHLWSERFIPGDRWDTEDARDLDAALKCVVEANPDRSRARVPVQEEPNDEPMGDVIVVDSLGVQWSRSPIGVWQTSKAFSQTSWTNVVKRRGPLAIYRKCVASDDLASRATVPDAATELAQLMAERDAGKQAEADRAYLYQLGLKLGAERDAALAVIERIRRAVAGYPECDRYEEGDVISCGWKSTYASVVAALDGAPEPEVKP